MTVDEVKTTSKKLFHGWEGKHDLGHTTKFWFPK